MYSIRRNGVQGMAPPVECAPGGQNQVDGKQDAVAGHGEGHPVRAGIHPGQEVHGRHAGEDRRHVHPHKADGLFRVGAVLVEEVDVVPPVPLSSNGRRTDAGGGFFEFHIGHPGQMHGLLGPLASQGIKGTVTNALASAFVGSLGGGKSFCNNLLVYYSVLFGGQAVILDPKSGAKRSYLKRVGTALH